MNTRQIGQTIGSTALTIGALTAGHPVVTEAADLASRIVNTGTPTTPILLAMWEAGSTTAEAVLQATLQYISPDSAPNVLNALPKACQTGIVPDNLITSDPRVTPEMMRLLSVSTAADAYDRINPYFPAICMGMQTVDDALQEISPKLHLPASLLPTKEFYDNMEGPKTEAIWMFFAGHDPSNDNPTIGTSGKIDFVKDPGAAALQSIVAGMTPYKSDTHPYGWETVYTIEQLDNGKTKLYTLIHNTVDGVFDVHKTDLDITGEIYPITYHGKLFIKEILPDGEVKVLAVDNVGHAYPTASPETLKALGDVKPVDIVREWGGNDPRYMGVYRDQDGNPQAVISGSGWYIGSERPADGDGTFKQTVNITVMGEDGPIEVVKVIGDNERLLMGPQILGPTEQGDGYYFAYATDQNVILGTVGPDGRVLKTEIPIPTSLSNPIGVTFERDRDGRTTGTVYGPHGGFEGDPEDLEQEVRSFETSLQQMTRGNGLKPAGASWRDPRLEDYPRQ